MFNIIKGHGNASSKLGIKLFLYWQHMGMDYTGLVANHTKLHLTEGP
jgi:hypothetical protein